MKSLIDEHWTLYSHMLSIELVAEEVLLHSQVMQRQLAKVALLVSVFSVRGFGFALRLEPAVVCFGGCLFSRRNRWCLVVLHQCFGCACVSVFWLCRCSSVLVVPGFWWLPFDVGSAGVWLSCTRVWLCCASILVVQVYQCFGGCF